MEIGSNLISMGEEGLLCCVKIHMTQCCGSWIYVFSNTQKQGAQYNIYFKKFKIIHQITLTAVGTLKWDFKLGKSSIGIFRVKLAV